MNKEKEKLGIRFFWDFFVIYRFILAIKNSASTFLNKKDLAEQKLLKRQQRNLCHASGFTSNKGKLA